MKYENYQFDDDGVIVARVLSDKPVGYANGRGVSMEKRQQRLNIRQKSAFDPEKGEFYQVRTDAEGKAIKDAEGKPARMEVSK